MKLLTKERQQLYENANICFICKEKFEKKYLKDKWYRKVRDNCHYRGKYRVAAHSICILKYGVPKKIPIVFHNGLNYDYDFIIKHLAEEFKKQFTCLEENTEKFITFTVPIEKEVTRIDENGTEIRKNISYILQFIDSARFIKLGFDDKKCETCGIKYKHCDCFLEYINFKRDLIEYKCLCCSKSYQRRLTKS